MRKYNVNVNGTAYEVTVEEIQGGAAPVAAPAPAPAAPAAVPAAPAPRPAGLGLENVECIHQRAEEFAGARREAFDFAVSRAVAVS